MASDDTIASFQCSNCGYLCNLRISREQLNTEQRCPRCSKPTFTFLPHVTNEHVEKSRAKG